ncbi:MAG: hypothetical protein H0W62_03165 [Chitinophagales bacterium]|nr:hypothetical protein [Chitinophagales bacterium]
MDIDKRIREKTSKFFRFYHCKPFPNIAGSGKAVCYVHGAFLFLLTFFNTSISSAQHKNTDTTAYYNSQWTKYSLLNNPDEAINIDTTLTYLYRYNPAEFPFGFMHLGNLGAAARQLYFFTPLHTDFDIGFHQFDIYRKEEGDIKFFDTKRPYTLVNYHQGSAKEIKGQLIHAQNIIPQWSAGLELNAYKSTGLYHHQQNNGANFNFSTQYSSKNNFYKIMAAFLLNNLKSQENGGVATPDVFNDSLIIDKSIADVYLDSAYNRWKDLSVVVQNSFGLGILNHQIKDSTIDKTTENRFQLFHKFSWEKRSFFFIDDKIDNAFFENIFIDSIKTRDTLRYNRSLNEIRFRIRNSDSVSWLKNFTGEVYFQHEFYFINSKLPSDHFQSGILGVSLNTRQINTLSRSLPLTFAVQGEYNFIGYNKGDYFVDIQAGYRFNNSAGFGFEFSDGRNHPSYIQQHYLSNHFQWLNEFVPVISSSASVYFTDIKWNLELVAKIYRTQNYISWNSCAIPVQLNSSFSGYSLFVQKNIKWGVIHFDNELLYQQFNNDTIISLPWFISRHSLYYEDRLFKGALSLKTGLDVRYNSNYYGAGYEPATGQFYNQHINYLSFYPVADLFAEIKIRSVRAYLMFQNINQGILSNGYYSAIHYPMPDRSFKFGISWTFWN